MGEWPILNVGGKKDVLQDWEVGEDWEKEIGAGGAKLVELH